MGFYETIVLAARVAQLIFSIIVLGTASYVASVSTVRYGGETYTYSQISFSIFVSIFSLLVVAFQLLAPRFGERLAHRFVILGLDGLCALFWFAAFVSVAVLCSALAPFNRGNSAFRTLQAAAAFGAFAWISFMITTVLSILGLFRNRGVKHAHNPEIGHSVA